MRRVGWTRRFVTAVEGESYYPVTVDGSEYCPSTKIAGAGCLRQRSPKGEIHYAHLVVAATVTRVGSHEILPLEAEEVRNTEGQPPQDCELTAAKRLVKRLRAEHRQLQICIIGDDLYAHDPFIQELRQWRMGFVLMAKPTSPAALVAGVDERERQGEGVRGTWEEGAGSRRRSFEYRSVGQVSLTQASSVRVNFVELWARDPAGQVLYHNSWVTEFAVPPEPVATIGGLGRARWKIENEQFNVHKNHGSEVGHKYGHGRQTLSRVFYLLNLLACVAHKVLEFGHRLYQKCRVGEARRGLGTLLRSAFYLVEVESWKALLLHPLRETVYSP